MMTSSVQLKLSGQLVFLQFQDWVNRDQSHLVMKVLEHSDWLKMSNHPNCHHLVMKAKIKFRKKFEKFRLIEKKYLHRCYKLYHNQLGISRYHSMGSKLDQNCTNSTKIKLDTPHRKRHLIEKTSYRKNILSKKTYRKTENNSPMKNCYLTKSIQP